MRKIDVHIHTNNSCNLRCLHCYVNNNSQSSYILSENIEVDLIRFLLDNYDPDIHLEGGEIFLVPNLISALSCFSSSELKKITITTNGTIRTENADVILSLTRIGMLRISVEGHTDELHRAMRESNVFPVLENALYYQELGIPVCLRITLNALNANLMFSEMIPSLVKKGFRNFQIYELQAVGRGKNLGLEMNEEWNGFFEALNKIPSGISLRINLSKCRAKEIDSYASKLVNLGAKITKLESSSSVSIGADCSVRICPWDMTSSPLFSIDAGNIEALKNIINASSEAHECLHCSAYSISFGG